MKSLLLGSLLSCMVVGQMAGFAAMRGSLQQIKWRSLSNFSALNGQVPVASLRPIGVRAFSSFNGQQDRSRYQEQKNSDEGAYDQSRSSWWTRFRNLFGFAAAYTAYQANNKLGHGLRYVYADENKIEDNKEVKRLLKDLQGSYPEFKRARSANEHAYDWEVSKVLETYPEARPDVMYAITKNIVAITTGRHDDYRGGWHSGGPILEILRVLPELRQPVLQAITDPENFIKIAGDRSGWGVVHIKNILEQIPESRKPIIQAIINNIVALAKEDRSLVLHVLHTYPMAEKPIITAIVNNLSEIASYIPQEVIAVTFKKYPEFGRAIVEIAINKAELFEKSRSSNDENIWTLLSDATWSYDIMCEALEYQELAKLVITYISSLSLEQQKEVPAVVDIIEKILEKYPESGTLFSHLYDGMLDDIRGAANRIQE